MHLGPFRNSLVCSRRQRRQLDSTYRDMDQTRRFFGGRQPLCGIGVTSRIETTRSPAEASAWMADSRPLPGPCTRTCTRRSPMFIASRAQFSAATVAANGVDFFEPLKPAFPADPHARVLPRMSVIVISRLLNVAEMCTTPSDSTTFLPRRAAPPLAGAAAGDAGASGRGAGVGSVITSSSLSSYRQWPGAAPSWSARSCGYAVHGPASPGDDG